MGIKEVWKKVKALSAPRRQLLVIVPSQGYMLELCSKVWDDNDAVRKERKGPCCVQLTYPDRHVKVLVTYAGGSAELVCRVKEQLLGRRDQDIVLVEPIAMGAALKHELQCLAATFEAKFTIVVDK